MWFIVAATPVSVNLTDLTGGTGLSLPTEPMLVLVTALVLLKMLIFGEYDKRLVRHPISIAIYVYMSWMLFTVITSQMPVVSLKQWITRLWFIVPYYFVLGHLFLKNPKNAVRFLWLFLVPLIITCLYTIFIHSQYGFTKKTSTWVMFPLFKDTPPPRRPGMFYPAFLLEENLPGVSRGGGCVASYPTAATILSCQTHGSRLSVPVQCTWSCTTNVQNHSLVFDIPCPLIAGLNFSYISSKFGRNTTDSSDDFNEHVYSVTNAPML